MASHVLVMVSPKGTKLEAVIGPKEKLPKVAKAIRQKVPGVKYRVCDLNDLTAIRRAAKVLGFERTPEGLYKRRKA